MPEDNLNNWRTKPAHAARGDVGQPWGAVSVTVIRFSRPWHADQAAQRWKRLHRELAGLGYRLESRYTVNRRKREVTFFTMARDEESLRRAAAAEAHVSAVRWAIVRRRSLWSGIFLLNGWSSMSGPHGGPWSVHEAPGQ